MRAASISRPNLPTVDDLLHDRIDAVEDLLDRARDIVERVMRQELDNALASSGQGIEGGLGAIAALVAQELDGVTTEAVRVGFESTERLLK